MQSVEVVKLGKINRRGRRIELFQAEFFNQISHAKKFRPVVITPTHQRDPVIDGFRQITQRLQILDKEGIAVLH